MQASGYEHSPVTVICAFLHSSLHQFGAKPLLLALAVDTKRGKSTHGNVRMVFESYCAEKHVSNQNPLQLGDE